MKYLTALLCASPILMTVTLSANAQSLDLAKKDVEEIRAKWEAAINSRSSAAAAAQSIAALFTDDGVINVSGNVQIGKAAIEKFYTDGIEANKPSDIHITVAGLDASGNVAWAYGSTTEKLGDKPADIFWGAVYQLTDGHYKVKVLTGGFKPPPAPSAAASE